MKAHCFSKLANLFAMHHLSFNFSKSHFKWVQNGALLVLILLANVASGQACWYDENFSPGQCSSGSLSNTKIGMGAPSTSTCSSQTFPVFFQNTIANQQVSFQALHVRFKIVGDAQFDPNGSITYTSNVLTTHTQGNSVWASNGKTLDWYVICSNFTGGGYHRMKAGTSSSQLPIFYANILTDAWNPSDLNDNITISIEFAEVTGLGGSGNLVTCDNDCCTIPLVSTIGSTTPGYTYACSNNLTGKFLTPVPFPASPADPEEITHSLVINNSGSSINYDEMDLRIRFLDQLENLPPLGIAQTSGNLPINSYANDDENGATSGETGVYYFKFGSGTLVNGDNPLLELLVLEPNGEFENLLGKSRIIVEYIRIKTSGASTCCKIMDETSVNCVFSGEPECNNGHLTIRIDDPQSTPSGPCNTGFTVDFNILGTGNLQLEELYMEIDVETYGVLDFSEIIANDASLSCVNATSCPNSGCATVCNNGKIIIDFSNPTSPLTVNNYDFFDVLFDGNNGGISSINVTKLKIKEVGSDACIPEFVVDPGLVFPIEKCDYCNDVKAATDVFAGSATLNSACESGFSLYLNLGSGTYDEVDMEFDLSLVGSGSVSINTTKSASFCDALSNSTCDPGSGSSNCMEITGNTVNLHYCGGTFTGTKRIDIALSGTGMVSGINFTLLKVKPVGGQLCDVLYEGAEPGVFPMVPSGPSCPDWNFYGYVQSDNGLFGLKNAEICVTNSVLGYSGSFPNEFDCSSPEATTYTNSGTGSYQVSFTSSSLDKYLTPTKNCDDLNGVSTFDLVLISKHVLTVQPLGSPYKIIAADANHNGTVSTFDLVEIRKLILFINTEYPNNASWRFVPHDYTFPNPTNPFSPAFNEYKKLTLGQSQNPPSDGYGWRFVAMKIGDVNNSADYGSACTSPFAPENESEDRTNSAISVLTSKSLNLKAGDSGWVDISINSNEPLVAWQLGLLFNPNVLQIDEIKTSPSLSDFNVDDNFGTTEIMDGKLRSIWYSPDGTPRRFDKGENIFRVHVKALRDISDASSAISIANNILKSLAYNESGTEFTIAMDKSDSNSLEGPSDKLVAKVIPNPFSDRVTFNLNVPQAGLAEITIYNQLGAIVAKWEGELTELENQVVFDNTNDWGTGVLNYVVKTSNQTNSGRIVKI